MKYIRTKDKIIPFWKANLDNIGGIEIIKTSDTIEELCDVFVKKSKETWNNYFKIGGDAFYIFDRKYYKEDLEHYDYYGAIWTDKGLIYVAKMNENRELKLL